MLKFDVMKNAPEIPDRMLAKWQRVVDILARLVDAPSGLIMKMNPPQHDVFVTSASEGNPYTTETTFTLNTGLYCDTVMAERDLLVVPDAREDPLWNKNPDLKHGMVFYMGYPLTWPDGSLFGTICVLDRQNNQRALEYKELLDEFREVIDSDLRLLVELCERDRVEKALQAAHDHLEERVVERTKELSRVNEELWRQIAQREKTEAALREREAELEETNTALKVLLAQVEAAKHDAEEKVVWNINEQIAPYVDKLKGLGLGGKAESYLSILDGNLKDISAQFPNSLASKFSSLTPTEIEVAKLIRVGKTTKEIAGIMCTAKSTIDFHRNNIRKKVGINSSNVSLRSYLTTLP